MNRQTPSGNFSAPVDVVSHGRFSVWSLLTRLEAVGRKVAIDVGLGSFIEKIEEYCGKKVTGVFIVLVVLAVSGFAMRAIWDNLIDPALLLFETPLWGQRLGNLLWMAGTIVLGVAGGIWLASALRGWRRVSQMKTSINEVKSLVAEAKEITSAISERNEESEAICDAASRALDNAVAVARALVTRDEPLSDEERAELAAELAKFDKIRDEGNNE